MSSDDAPWWGRRTWTPAEATAALPLVRRIVDDLVATHTRWRATVDAFEIATGSAAASAPSAEADRLMAAAQTLAGEIDALRAELADLDIRVIRVERGLVAFRSSRAGEVVPLYWSLVATEPSYDAPDPADGKGTSTSMPSRAHEVA